MDHQVLLAPLDFKARRVPRETKDHQVSKDPRARPEVKDHKDSLEIAEPQACLETWDPLDPPDLLDPLDRKALQVTVVLLEQRVKTGLLDCLELLVNRDKLVGFLFTFTLLYLFFTLVMHTWFSVSLNQDKKSKGAKPHIVLILKMKYAQQA